MKKKLVRKALYSLLMLLPAAGALAADKVLNVYNWSDYIAKTTIPASRSRPGSRSSTTSTTATTRCRPRC
ncbi:putrescine transporter subunit: periplasmic-binding component of ABC superfamily [Chromobacterium violaceum]|uniref:Putrescine transporter subunit: periplasmic-binding component of ABC superfamily n=1 Tax=Chromobacterium violaceum TaxID=536 RepID=A0A3S4LHB5_CHRVL|nr:putrescine transporter subunit: periplasmic-binding component of ABC superfamily [Chromobacterium violaceum]